MPPSYNGNHVRSYGGYLRYNLRYSSTFRPRVHAPDVILVGNGLSLIHVVREPLLDPGRSHEISVRFWPGEWFKRVTGRPGGDQPSEGREPASREEIVFVLANIENLLLRVQYEQDSLLDTEISNIRMDTASTQNIGKGQAYFVEECRCPKGYSGLSCSVRIIHS